MKRYIDADALLVRLPDDLPYKASVRRVLAQAPTADVAQRTEVAREIFAEISKLIYDTNLHIVTYLDDELDGGEHTLKHIQGLLAELEKKYTEETK